jgi:hypothetical protein
MEATAMTMLYASLLFAAGAAVLFGRWFMNHQAGRLNAFPAISVSSCAVLAVFATLPLISRADLESRLSHDASTLLGIKVKVVCQTLTGSAIDMGSELGFVKWGADGAPEHSTLIKHDQCNDLEAYLDGNKQHPSGAQMIAVHVLTHESMHMSGITNEAEAECDATQNDSRMAQIMGAPPEAARALALRYWATVYPYMRDGYRTSDCRAGGALDLHLPDPPWTA